MNSVRSTEEGGEETSAWQGFPEVSEASFGGSRGMVLSRPQRRIRGAKSCTAEKISPSGNSLHPLDKIPPLGDNIGEFYCRRMYHGIC